ncbi:hypothetical protein BHE74_00039351, partial [Ensete ventricosum]
TGNKVRVFVCFGSSTLHPWKSDPSTKPFSPVHPSPSLTGPSRFTREPAGGVWSVPGPWVQRADSYTMIVSALAFGRLSVRTAAFSGPLCLLADDVRHTECTPNERPHRVESDRSSQIPLPCGSSSRPSSLGDDSRLRVLHPPAAQHNPYTSFDLVLTFSVFCSL